MSPTSASAERPHDDESEHDMTVAELIDRLTHLPGGAEVSVAAESGPGQQAPARSVQAEGNRVLITGDDEQCPHPADKRGRIMAVDGPVNVCGRCCGVVS